jgi:hypothetical protein
MSTNVSSGITEVNTGADGFAIDANNQGGGTLNASALGNVTSGGRVRLRGALYNTEMSGKPFYLYTLPDAGVAVP